MPVNKYAIALRRDQAAPKDWLERIGRIEGVTVQGATANRAQIEAPPEAVEKIRDDLGEHLLIEGLVEHGPSQADDVSTPPTGSTDRPKSQFGTPGKTGPAVSRVL